MKITKTNKDVNRLEGLKAVASIGCDRCPCCGETKTFAQYLREDGICQKGISGGIYRSWYEGGLFKKGRNVRVDCYSCYTCGAEWESEPYEW